MAQLNTFKSLQYTFTNSEAVIYTAPVGYTAIILNAQCANKHTANVTVSFKLRKPGTPSDTDSVLVDDLVIPINDAANLATGKLVLQPGDKIMGVASHNSALDLTLSFLETLDA